MQTIMNCFPVPPPPLSEILDPPTSLCDYYSWTDFSCFSGIHRVTDGCALRHCWCKTRVCRHGDIYDRKRPGLRHAQYHGR